MGLWEPVPGKGWKPCECQKIRAAEKRLERSGLSQEIKEKTFKNFKTDYPWQQGMKDAAIAYGKAFFEAKEAGAKLPWFYVAGMSGCGKTHLCTAICGAMLKREVPVVYMPWVTESRRLRGFINEPDTFDEMASAFIDTEVLYIDDLFKQSSSQELNPSNAEVRVLYEIANARCIQNKPTIISSEWYLEDELMQIDVATFSRIYERSKGHTVNIGREMDKNYRINGAKEEAKK